MTRILLVDDDDLVRDLLHETLRFGGLEIATAHDGPTALAEFRASAPDVVVLDLDLPGELSGLDILQRLKAEGARARFVVLTGSGRGRESALRAAGATGYLTKPFSPLELITQIEAALAST
jgi:CheY-like chemotaxis protein